MKETKATLIQHLQRLIANSRPHYGDANRIAQDLNADHCGSKFLRAWILGTPLPDELLASIDSEKPIVCSINSL